MDAPEFTEECRDSRSFVRSSRRRWQRTIAGRGLRARRAVSAMQRTQSDPTGENSARAGARSVALISRFDDEDEDVGSGFTRRPQPLHRAVSDGLFSQHLERAAAQASDEEPEECGKEDAREVDLLQPPRK